MRNVHVCNIFTSLAGKFALYYNKLFRIITCIWCACVALKFCRFKSDELNYVWECIVAHFPTYKIFINNFQYICVSWLMHTHTHMNAVRLCKRSNELKWAQSREVSSHTHWVATKRVYGIYTRVVYNVIYVKHAYCARRKLYIK